ncbi:hypothetical protein MY1884_006863 [Beauveria asiatica]
MPSSPDHDCTRDGMIAEESPGPLQSLLSSTDEVIHASDDRASDRADATSRESCAASPHSVKTVVQSLEDTGNMGTTTPHDCDQTSKYEDKREATHRSMLPRPDETQANQSAGLSSVELAGCSSVVSPSTSRLAASMATRGPAILPVINPLPESRSEDPVSTQMNPSISAARKRPFETESETCTETILPETSGYEPKAFECTDGKTMTTKPLTSRMRSQLQNKRPRDTSADHDTEQREVERSPRESDDPEYCPSRCHELETDSDRHFSDKNQPLRKRHKTRIVSAKAKSQIQEINQRESAGLDQGSQLISEMSDDADNMGEPINAAFDEWILQDVVLKRTIMDGKATFLFQFDWDLCMKHGAETGREGSMKQGRGKSILNSNRRSCRKPRDETKGRRCRRCGLAGHNARTCQNSIEPFDDEEE